MGTCMGRGVLICLAHWLVVLPGAALAFFENIRAELTVLHRAGAEIIRFTELRECTLILRGEKKWNKRCESLLAEIQAFLKACDHEVGLAKLSIEA